MPKSFRLNSPAVVAESIDGEALIVNLDTGCYYSTDGTGEVIWSRAMDGLTLENIVLGLQARFAEDVATIDAAVHRFARQLLDEGLLVPVDEVTPTPVDNGEPPLEKLAFEEPVLNKYSDMQELLMLDPIHEVDESGWPNPAGAKYSGV